MSNKDRYGNVGVFESETTSFRIKCESAQAQKQWFDRIAALIASHGSDQQKQAANSSKGGGAAEQKEDLLSAASAPPADDASYPAISSNAQAAYAPSAPVMDNNGNDGGGYESEGQTGTHQ